MGDPLAAMVQMLAEAVAARIASSASARADDPAWGRVSQSTLPPWIHAKAYVEACRAGRIAGARLWRRQWIAERAAVEAWWIAESRDAAANDGPGDAEPESDAAVLASAGLVLRPASPKRRASR